MKAICPFETSVDFDRTTGALYRRGSYEYFRLLVLAHPSPVLLRPLPRPRPTSDVYPVPRVHAPNRATSALLHYAALQLETCCVVVGNMFLPFSAIGRNSTYPSSTDGRFWFLSEKCRHILAHVCGHSQPVDVNARQRLESCSTATLRPYISLPRAFA
jgi:hypothetical protein